MSRTKVRKVELRGAADTGGGIGSWRNPESGPIFIDKVEVDITMVSTGACTMDVGSTATGPTTSADNLLDGLDVNAATGLFDNITEKGTNGKSRARVAAGSYVNFSRATGASAGLVGTAYIHYHRL